MNLFQDPLEIAASRMWRKPLNGALINRKAEQKVEWKVDRSVGRRFDRKVTVEPKSGHLGVERDRAK